MGLTRPPTVPTTKRFGRLAEWLFRPAAPAIGAVVFALVVGSGAVYAEAVTAWSREAQEIARMVRFTGPSAARDAAMADGHETMRLSRFVVVRSSLVANDPDGGVDKCAAHLAEHLGALLGTPGPGADIAAVVGVCGRGETSAHVATDIPRLVILRPHYGPDGRHEVTEITIVETTPRPTVVDALARPTVGMALFGIALSAGLLAWRWSRATQRRMADLWAAAALDGQTGMLRRETFLTWLAGSIAEARVDRVPLSILVIDIDNLKLINDSQGHAAGDAAIRIVAASIAEALGTERVVGRLGGDEFVALLVGTRIDEAMVAAEAIRAAVAAARVTFAGHAVATTVSIGVAALGADDDAGGVIRRADAALYAAKGASRNRVVAAG